MTEAKMECYECPRAYECHDKVKDDISILNVIKDKAVNFDHIGTLAAIEIFKSRLEKRNTEITGR